MFSTTKEVRIEPSTLCTYDCLMCPRDSFRRVQKVMENELFDLVLEKVERELPWIRILTLSGFGEPFTDRDWKVKLYRASKRFEKIHVVTNLSLLKQQDITYLLQHISDIRVSVYGIDERTYRAIHRPPDSLHYTEIAKKILQLIDEKKSGQRISLNYIELEENRYQTTEWIQFWKGKVDVIEVWRPHNWIEGKQYRKQCEHRIPTCGRPLKGPIQIQVDGTVNICCYDYNGELTIGDLKRQSFKDIFEGKEIMRIQSLHRDGYADHLRTCAICDQRNCPECVLENRIFSSQVTRDAKVVFTSTGYENLS